MKSHYILAIPILVNSLGANAEVTLDGSLGRNGALPGPNYLIGADLGQQRGGNLFHSFQDFNLNRFESATFSGPNSLNNIISRVTGGNPSNIDGLIRSTVPADMYFLNPNGIMFGPNARLDVQGSFHVSTADYLRLADGGRFDARNPSQSLLTIAPISAFGFFTDSPASLSLEGSQLAVPTEKTLSLVAGNLTLNHAELKAPFGRINLASVADIGDVIPNNENFMVPSLRGDILMRDSQLSTTGEGGGAIYIRTGQFFASNSEILAETIGEQDGNVIDIQANTFLLTDDALISGDTYGDGTGGSLTITAENISVEDESAISTMAFDNGNSGNIMLRASELVLVKDNSSLESETESNGNGGQLTIHAKNISFENLSLIITNSFGDGDASDVEFQADNISLESSTIEAKAVGSGNAGNVKLQADNISFEGSSISTDTNGSGNAGNVTLLAKNRLSLTGINEEEDNAVYSSRVYTSSVGIGNAGNILVEAHDVLLTDNAYLVAPTFSHGQGGNVRVHATGTVTITGTNKDGWASTIGSGTRPLESVMTEGIKGGDSGNVVIEAHQLILKKGGFITTNTVAHEGLQSGHGGNITIRVKGAVEMIGVNPYGTNHDGFGSGIYADTIGVGDNTGDGGNISLEVGSLTIKDGAVIRSSSNTHAQGGNIDIRAQDTVSISGAASQIQLQEPASAQLFFLQEQSPINYNQSRSGIYASSDNISEQAGSSGDITLSAQHLILTNQGKISTTSVGGGRAGYIRIKVDKLQIDQSASITSESHLSNVAPFSSVSERDNRILILGDVIEVADMNNGKMGNFINVGTYLIKINSVYHVENLTGLDELANQYNLMIGDIAEVKDTGSGESASFFYANEAQSSFSAEWFKFEPHQVTTTLTDMTELAQIRDQWYSAEDPIPYSSGDIIQVADAGDGKPANFVYALFPDGDDLYSVATRINQLTVTNIAALHEFTEQNSVQDGDVATVTDVGHGSRFIYQDNTWIKFNIVHTVANFSEMNSLTLAQAGYVAQIANADNGQSNSFIYSGIKWIPLNPNRRTVQNLTELNQLSAKNGDLVKVEEGETNQHFFYVDGEWIRQVKGGNAGTITITAKNIHLSNTSSITTEAVSAGGGGITLKVDNLVYLTDSQVSTSVQEGVGSGGDLTIKEPQFVIMNNGKIIAQAYEGHGGNIHLGGKQLVKSPCSQISASSKLGIDGDVNVESPEVNLDDLLVVLPGGTRPEAKFSTRCHIEDWDDVSTFVKRIHGDGRPRMPDNHME